MRRILLTLTLLGTTLSATQASIVFTEQFSYADGGLITNSAGMWNNNSGIAGSLLVSNGWLQVAGDTTGRTEDAYHPLPGGPFETNSGTVLYTSYTVNFSNPPSTLAGTYFSHFNGTNVSSIYRGRVWAALTNFTAQTSAAPGNFFLYVVANAGGTANGDSNGTNMWPNELQTNVNYTVVTRYEVGTTRSTLWVGTNAAAMQESDPSIEDQFYATNVPVSILGYQFRQATGEGNLQVDDLKVGTLFSDVAGSGGGPVNNPPSISPVANQASVPMNTTIGPINFAVLDTETPAVELVVTAASSNTNLVPNGPSNLILATNNPGGGDRSITIVPANNQQGVSTITLGVSDGTNAFSRGFTVTLGQPSFITTKIPNQILPMGSPATPTAALPFTVWDYETPESLTVSAASSNPGLIPSGNVLVSGTGTNRTVTVTPVAGTNGYARVTLTVSDGILSSSNSFYVTVYPQIGVVLSDDFGYPDGLFATDGTYQWLFNGTFGTGSNDNFIVSGQLHNAYTNYDDIYAQFTNANGRIIFNTGQTNDELNVPASYAGGVLYAKFTITSVQLPFEQGTYFAGFETPPTSTTLKGRVAVTNGAAPGTYRIGVSAATTLPSAIFPRDLNLNTPYKVVVRYTVPTGDTALWIDPAYETSQNVTAADTTSGSAMGRFQFRQASGTNYNPGVFHVDDLVVGTAFTDVVPYVPPPSPPTLNVSFSGGQMTLQWSDSRFSLYSSPVLTAPPSSWTLVPGVSPITVTPTGSQQYYLLRFDF